MEYSGGTECDLTGRLRATSVHFVCGEGGVDQFLSVKEDRSCHYRVVIATPRLCRHPAFRKQLPSARTIRCTASAPALGERGAGGGGGGAPSKQQQQQQQVSGVSSKKPAAVGKGP